MDGYTPVTPPPLGSDGHCTGTPDSLGPYDFLHCCIEHDLGGSDGMLIDCLTTEVRTETPQIAWLGAVLVLGVVFWVKVFQPIYNAMQRRGWVK